MASLPYPRTPLFHVYTPLSSASRSSFHFSPHLFSSSYSLLLSSASVGADARNGRRGCSYRPTRMTFVDVSCCQTFTFAVSNLYFHYVKPLLLRFKTSLFTFYTLFFFPYLLLFSSISSAFLLCASSGCSP